MTEELKVYSKSETTVEYYGLDGKLLAEKPASGEYWEKVTKIKWKPKFNPTKDLSEMEASITLEASK